MKDTKKSKRRTAVSGNKAASVNDTTLQKTLRASLFGFLISVALGALLLFVGTAVAYSTADPLPLIPPIAYTVLYLSALFGGFACAKLNKRAPYLTCSLCSGAFLLLGFVISALIPDSNDSVSSLGASLLLRSAEILIFFLGAAIGASSSSTTSRGRKKHHKKTP